jgi:outer membrane protein OmpA-like peptidoglycan-associated protein
MTAARRHFRTCVSVLQGHAPLCQRTHRGPNACPWCWTSIRISQRSATVEGHSGNVHADPERAMELSRQRADSVVRYLTDELGVNPAQVSARGFGLSRLNAYGTSAEGQQENRRVNIILNYPESR